MCKFFWFPQTETSHRKNVKVHLWLQRIMISAQIIWCIWYTTILHPYKCDNTVTDWHDEMIFNGKGKGETRIKLTPRQVRDHEDFWIQDKPVVKMSRGVRLIDPVCVWVQYFIVSFSRFDLLEQIYAFFCFVYKIQPFSSDHMIHTFQINDKTATKNCTSAAKMAFLLWKTANLLKLRNNYDTER